jgi:hypothetical protein
LKETRRSAARPFVTVLSAILLISCAGTLSVADATAQLRQATDRYAHLVAAMDGAGIAAMYTADGESVVVGQPPILRS